MTKVLLPALFLFFFQEFCFSQKLQYDAIKKKIYFEDELKLTNINQQQLADQIWQWIEAKVPNSSLKYQDDQSGEFVIKTSNNFVNPIGPDYRVRIWYEMKIFTEDNLASYRFSKIIFENLVLQDGEWISHKLPAEKILMGVGYYQPNGRPKRLSEVYSNETLRIMYMVSTSLKDFIHNHEETKLADSRNN